MVLQDPRGMVRAILPEVQSQKVPIEAYRKGI